MKAMILAAGRGRRLGMLTDSKPKPLVTVAGRYLIEYQIAALVRAGICDLVINVCYRAQDIIDALGDGSRYGAQIHYSYEHEVGGLETGGGVLQALPLLGEQPFIVTSADVWTDFPYAELHLPANQLAHLVLVDNPSFHPDGDYALNAAGQVCSKGERYNYAGIAVLSPALFVGCQPGRFGLKQVYDRAMQQGQLSGEYYCGGWFNVGTQVELAALTEHLSLIGRE